MTKRGAGSDRKPKGIEKLKLIDTGWDETRRPGWDERKRDSTKGEETSRNGMGPFEKRQERLNVNNLIMMKRSERKREETRQDGAGQYETRRDKKLQDHGSLKKNKKDKV